MAPLTATPDRLAQLGSALEDAEARRKEARARGTAAMQEYDGARSRLARAEASFDVDPLELVRLPALMRTLETRIDAAERDFQRAFKDGRRLRHEIDTARGQLRLRAATASTGEVQQVARFEEFGAVVQEREQDIAAITKNIADAERDVTRLEAHATPEDTADQRLRLLRARQTVSRYRNQLVEAEQARERALAVRGPGALDTAK